MMHRACPVGLYIEVRDKTKDKNNNKIFELSMLRSKIFTSLLPLFLYNC